MSTASGLNPQQQQAAQAANGPLCIVAGPGTGKTKTLTARIVHLLTHGTPASSILALTFTNKAAREMRERVVAGLPAGAELPLIATFHSLCHRLLSADGQEIAFIDDTMRQQILRDIRKSQELSKLSVRELSLLVSKLKNQTDEPADPAEQRLLTAYNQALAHRGLHDFDDLLLRVYQRLQQHPDQVPTYQHILVDEFQDTNDLQYELLRLLSKTDSVCVIGDPLQSIYGFRGASAAVFDRFLTDWPDARQVTLTTNYRSVPQVVAVANAVFADAPQLQAHTSEPGEAKAVEVLDAYTEAAWVIDHIEQGVGGSDFLKSSQQQRESTARQRGFRDFAVLYRTHIAAKIVRQRLDESGIPYQVAGEGSPYQRPELAAVIAGLRFVAGQQVPVDNLTPTQTATLLEPLKQEQLPPSQLAQKIATLLGVDQKLPPHDLQQFMNTVLRFDNQPLTAFLDYLDRMAEQEFYDPAAEAVTLLTIHAAKGLEFAHVFLLAAEEDILPHSRKGTVANLDEERRLFYVAVTRARDTLHVLHARSRGGQPAKPSRFIIDLPPTVLPRTLDPAIAAQQQKRQRARQKRAQTSLF